MALQVWLPLNKENDFKNKGLTDIIISNSNITYDANGKIGGCYRINSGKPLSYGMSLSTSGFSIALWVKPDSISGNKYIFGTGLGSNLRYMACLYQGYWCLSYGSRRWSVLLVAASPGWHHVAVTSNANLAIMYVDGELVDSVSQKPFNLSDNVTIGSRDGGNSPTAGLYNDVRIYNHCLSPKEVKEISKGLVLHYPLNTIDYSPTIYDCSGYQNDGTITGTLTTSTDTPKYDKCITILNSAYLSLPQINYAQSFSFWIKKLFPIANEVVYSNGSNKLAFGFYPNGKGFIVNNAIYSKGTYSNEKWNHITVTSTRVYINGEELNNIGTNYWTDTSLVLNIGQRNSGTNFTGNISDFRIYSIDLSEEDVKELYNTSALIDNQLSLYSYEFIEDSNSEINKTGTINTYEFFEDTEHTDKNTPLELGIYEDAIKFNQLIEI